MVNGFFLAGCICSVVGSVIDNWGMNLQKAAHKKNTGNIYCNRTWIFGFGIYILGQILNFVSLSLIDQPTQSILSSFALFSNLAFAKYYFNEQFQKSDLIGLFCVSSGASLFVLFFVHRKQIYTVAQLENQFYQPEFVWLMTSLLIIITMCSLYVNTFSEAILTKFKIISSITQFINKITCSEQGENAALAYAVIAAIIGGCTVTFSKIVSVIIPALVDSKAPEDADTSVSVPFLLLIVFIWVILLFTSVHSLNVGLKNSPALVMIPIFYVLIGTIYFEEYETFESAGLTLICIFGVFLTLNGIHMLSKRVASAKAAETTNYRLHVDSISSNV
eukprot:snap_masked-scaffold_2-processed-gene-18.39-mRNA-1 protein AED:1.00 eAED:1.00 QI:0/0/0/0/1/1/2/0/332